MSNDIRILIVEDEIITVIFITGGIDDGTISRIRSMNLIIFRKVSGC